MSRRRYDRSDETYMVLRNHVSAISKEYPCDPSYIYGIKNGDSNDPYPHFRHLFLAAARGGAPVSIYIDDLEGIRLNAAADKPSADALAAELLKKIHSNSDATAMIVDALKDRHLDKSECHTILAALAREADTNSRLEQIVKRQLAEIED
ncbi:MAG: hypothetical protein AB7F88_19790 [Pyrinomonadaceae bacterium]